MTPTRSNRHVIIIGGGLSGLTTAYLLAPHFRVTLLEADARPGGQARAYKIDGVTVEHGSHAFFGYYETTVELMKQLGTRDFCVQIPGWTIVDAYGRTALLQQAPGLPKLVSVIPSIFRVPWLTFGDKIRTILASWRLSRLSWEDFLELDGRTAWQLGKDHGYSPQGLWTWNSASLGLTNLFVHEQSGTIFTGKHKVLVATRRGLAYLLPDRDLSEVLANPLHRAIEARGGQVLCGARVTSVERLPGGHGAERVRVGYEHDGANHTIAGQYGIVALQPWDAAALLDWVDRPWKNLQRVTPVITMTIGLSGRVEASPDAREYGFSREQWAFSVVTDLSRFWPEFRGDRTVFRVEVGHADLLPHGADMDEAGLVQLVKQDLDRFWPECKKFTVEWAKVLREKDHLYVRWTQGEFAKKPRPEDRDLGNNLYLAGDWTTKGTIGMEAACNSAYEAANFVLSAEGLEPLRYVDVPLD